MGRYCDHQFFMIGSSTEEVQGSKIWRLVGTVVCAFCGQVKVLRDDGTVTITVDEGQLIKPKRNEPVGH